MGVTLFYNTECPDCAGRRIGPLARRVRRSVSFPKVTRRWAPCPAALRATAPHPTRPADRRSWQTGLQW